jgi:RNA polymerase sigma-70 factor, ECF subfamily
VELDEPIPAFDPELARLRAHYGDQFKQAFGDAFASLSKRDRTILRHRFADGLDIDAIGAIYGVHRSTAARWLHQIRVRLREETFANLAALLAVSIDELSSVLRFIGSELDAGISMALRS